VNSFGPTMGSVKESSASVCGDVLNAVLGTTILVVGIDAAKGKGLTSFQDGVAKGCGIE
jgi:hypothetical protein